MNIKTLVEVTYIISAILFILGLKLLSSPKTAARGNLISATGMLIAAIVTLLNQEIVAFQWILLGIIAGSIIGAFAALRIEMTAMPEMVALFNGFGGAASFLVGWAEYHRYWNIVELNVFTVAAIFLAIVIGSVTFSGSIVAYGKLSGNFFKQQIILPGQKILNGILLLSILILGWFLCIEPLSPQADYAVLLAILSLALFMGITSIIPIGGADMPVVISLLNSYSGLAACAAGFVILNNVLIVVGALVGASGIILTKIMCKSMNRSLVNVLFSGFGSKTKSKSAKEVGEVKPISAEDAYFILEAAKSVIIVPGYGMAVAQAQHVVRELAEFLEANGTEVKYVVHPVAGRMPGHMNVLLAEANVPYEELVEPDDVNPIMESVDVCLIIGANDVVNIAARDDQSSPIYGMPIIEADRASAIFILKRSMNPGFAGIDNPLFTHPNTRMLFGDGKESVSKIIAEFKSSLRSQ